MAVSMPLPAIADILKQYREELNQNVLSQQKFTGTAADLQERPAGYIPWGGQAQTQAAPPDPRILAGKISRQLDALVKPMQAIEALNEHIERLETLALKLYVSLDEAIQCGKPITPNERPRPMTAKDWQNWQTALAEYRDFVGLIDV